MKKGRMIILLGTLVALMFFYIGLNQWLERKPQSQPLPPVVVKPMPPAGPPQEDQTKVSQPEQPPVVQKEEQKQPQEDQIAKKIEEEKKKERVLPKEERKADSAKKPELTHLEQKKVPTPKEEIKEYTIQIGAFSSKENAEKTLSKAKEMGYTASIVHEDDFYKVRVKVRTDNPNKEIAKLKSAFGSAFIKR